MRDLTHHVLLPLVRAALLACGAVTGVALIMLAFALVIGIGAALT